MRVSIRRADSLASQRTIGIRWRRHAVSIRRADSGFPKRAITIALTGRASSFNPPRGILGFPKRPFHLAMRPCLRFNPPRGFLASQSQAVRRCTRPSCEVSIRRADSLASQRCRERRTRSGDSSLGFNPPRGYSGFPQLSAARRRCRRRASVSIRRADSWRLP